MGDRINIPTIESSQRRLRRGKNNNVLLWDEYGGGSKLGKQMSRLIICLRMLGLFTSTTTSTNVTTVNGLIAERFVGHVYGLFASDSRLFAPSMVRIFAGYIIEQDELVRPLKTQGWGPEPGEPEFTVDDAWMNFMSWRGAQLRRGDLKTLFPWPVCVAFSSFSRTC